MLDKGWSFVESLIAGIPEKGLDVTPLLTKNLTGENGAEVISRAGLFRYLGQQLEASGSASASRSFEDGIITRQEAIALLADFGNSMSAELKGKDWKPDDDILALTQRVAERLGISDGKTVKGLAAAEAMSEIIFAGTRGYINEALMPAGVKSAAPPLGGLTSEAREERETKLGADFNASADPQPAKPTAPAAGPEMESDPARDIDPQTTRPKVELLKM